MGLRAGLWVDGDNIAAAARRAGYLVHYEMLREHFAIWAGVSLPDQVVAVVFLHAQQDCAVACRQHRFIEMVRRAGFSVFSVDGKPEWVDRMLEVDIMAHVCWFGKEFAVGIVAGDSGYVPLVKHLVERGNRVAVYGFAGDVSRELMRAASEFVDLVEAGLVVPRRWRLG